MELNQEQKAIADTFLVPFESPEQLRDWAFNFLGIDFPLGKIDPTSNSSPAEWLFDAYTAIRNNLGNEKPTYVVYSSRDSYKTLSCSALEVIVMIHFELTIAHMAAIEPQSKKAVQYINSFLRKVKPYLEYHGRNIESQNTRNIAIKNKEGEICYVTVIICTLTGANCISPDTIIHYNDGTTKKASDVKVGDTLKTWDYSINEMVPVTVGSVSYTQKHAREIVFDDGSNVVVSDDHQVFTQKGWIPAGKVRLGDKFTDFEGSSNIKTEYTVNTPDFKSLDQYLKGSLLGDGSLYKTKNKVRYQVSHCKDQLPYLHAIKKLFDDNDIEASIIPDKNNMYKLTTKTSDIFTEYLGIYNEKKEVTRGWLEGLDFEGIAYWFMDDGSGNGKVVGKSKDKRFTLATCCFSRKENEIIRDFFNEKGFPCKISKTSNGKKEYNIIEFTLEASRNLSDEIRQYFIPEMEYKLLPSKDLSFARCIKTGKLVKDPNGHGFSYSGESAHKTRSGRKWTRKIKENLKSKVVEINLIGKQDLIDIHIDTDNEHRKSFLSNSMKLLHNSEHTNIMVIDEVDVVRFPQAYEEAKLIPGVLHGRHPITIMTSTRKFAFGLMQQEIDKANEHNYPVLHWNILDITEKCPESRHQPELPKEIRYTAKELPLRNISPLEYETLQEEKKKDYKKQEAYAGCAKCPLLPVCETRLAHRPEKDVGGLYKPIDFTINQFNKVNPDMGEAQLLCFSEDAQVLMSDGTCKPIKEVEVGDFVVTHLGNTKQVTELFKRWYEGKTYVIDGPQWKSFGDTHITEEHPYFINASEWKEVKDINKFEFSSKGKLKKKGDYLSLPSNYITNGKDYVDYIIDVDPAAIIKDEKIQASSSGRSTPSKYELNKDFGWVLGYYLAEGYITKRDHGGGKGFVSVVFCSHRNETVFHEKIRSFAELSGVSSVDQPKKKGQGYTQTIYSKAIAKMFNVLCGELSHNKFLRKDLINSNQEFLEGVLEGFYAGDGTKRHEPQKELTTTSYKLATQLFLIASRLGLTPRIKKCKLIKGKKQVYRVYYRNTSYVYTQKRTSFKFDSDYNQYRQKDIKTDTYSGHVYNIEVDGDHSYIVDGAAVHNCWKPSSTGLVYGRFDAEEGENVITLDQAYYEYTGVNTTGIILDDLIDLFHRKGINFYVGGDWGYAHAFALIAGAVLPSKEFWLFETLAIPGLEYEDMIKYAIHFRDKYKPKKWFMDTAQPMFIKGFRRRKMPCKDFKKDVLGGIESIRGQIVDASGRRYLKVLKTEENEILIKGFQQHHFKTDASGNITKDPDDGEFADVMDSLRYMGQNLFAPKGNIRAGAGVAVGDALRKKRRQELYKQDPNKVHSDVMVDKIRRLAVDNLGETKGKSEAGQVYWDFSDPFDDT